MQTRNTACRILTAVTLLALLLNSSTVTAWSALSRADRPAQPVGEPVSLGSDVNSNSVSFTQHTVAGDFHGARSTYAIDVDSDGDTDILGASSVDHKIAWWENDGSENFTQHTITDTFGGATSVYATDVDGDGDVDVLGAACNAGDIAWWENDGDESFTQHIIAATFDCAFSVYATDVDGDEDIDILGAALSADAIKWWENDGSESFTQHTVAGSFDGARSVYATDVDGDEDIDILGAARYADDMAWWENDGSENFTQHTVAGSFDGARSVYATDVDGDEDIDILGTAYNADDIAWWENDGDESFTQHIIAATFDGASSVYATDVDGDMDVDVLGTASGADAIKWWENDGDESFTQRAIASDFDGARSVYATDVDGDKDIDVLGAASSGEGIAWWEQEGTPLVLPTALDFGATLTDLALSINAANPSTAWTLSESLPWLSLSSTGGAGGDTVIVSVDRAGLSEGTHNGTINGTVGGQAVTVDVTARVVAPDVTIITPSTGSTVHHNDSLLVKANATHDGQALSSGQVAGRIALDTVAYIKFDLHDDGNHEDGAAEDGIYASRITLYGPGTMPASGNPYSLTVTATAVGSSGSDSGNINLATSSGAPEVALDVSGPNAPDYFVGEQITATATLTYPDSSIHTDTAVTLTLTASDLSVTQVSLTNVAGDTWRGAYTLPADQGGTTYLDVRADPPGGSDFADGWGGSQVEVYLDTLVISVTNPPGTYYRNMAVPLNVCVTAGGQAMKDAEATAEITPEGEGVQLTHTTGGCYSGDYYPTESGAHQVTFAAHVPAYKSGSANGSFAVSASDPELAGAVTDFADDAASWSEETMGVAEDVAQAGDWFRAKIISDKIHLMIEFSMDAIGLVKGGCEIRHTADFSKMGLPGAAKLGSAEDLLETFIEHDVLHSLTEWTTHSMDEIFMSFARAHYRYYATGGSPNVQLDHPRDYIEKQYTTLVPTNQGLRSHFYSPLDSTATQLQEDIQSRADEVVGNLPSLTVEEEVEYISDFARRQSANEWLAHYDLYARSDLMFEVKAKREYMEQDEFRKFVLFLSEAGLKVGMTRLFGKLGKMAAESLLTAYHAYVNNSNIEQDQHFRDIAVGLMQRAHNAQLFIGSNTLSGLNLVEEATPPQTPGGEIISTDLVRTTPELSLGFVTRDVYVDLEIENTGDSSADYAVVAYYSVPKGPGSYRQVLEKMNDPATGEQLSSITLASGSQETVRMYFVEHNGDDFGIPKYGVFLVLYALTDRGVYVLDVESIAPFEPRTEVAASATQAVALKSPSRTGASAALSLSNSVHETRRYPIWAMVGANTGQFTYTLNIAADNPFPMPLAVVISQTIPAQVTVTDPGEGAVSGDEIAWHQIIQPRETAKLQYAFDYGGAYAAEATLPPVYWSFYDAADDVNVTLNTGSISFYARSPLRAQGTASAIVPPGVQQTVPVTVTNMDSGSAQQGDLTLQVRTITSTEVLSTTTHIWLGAGASHHDDLTYTAPDKGLYVLDVSLHYDDETMPVVYHLLKVRKNRVYLPLVLLDYDP